jgi:hypothetical protein
MTGAEGMREEADSVEGGKNTASESSSSRFKCRRSAKTCQQVQAFLHQGPAQREAPAT